MSPRAIEKLSDADPKCLYLKNGERGQTPFTPAVGVLIQLHERLRRVMDGGGAAGEIVRIAARAAYFRKKIEGLPFSVFSESPCNSVTALKTADGTDAVRLFTALKDKYGIFICPNGGALAHSVFRVGHIGNILNEDIDGLADALVSILRNGEAVL